MGGIQTSVLHHSSAVGYMGMALLKTIANTAKMRYCSLRLTMLTGPDLTSSTISAALFQVTTRR